MCARHKKWLHIKELNTHTVSSTEKFMKIRNIVNRKNTITALTMMVFCYGLLFYSTKCAAEDSQDKIIPTPSSDFFRDVLRDVINEAWDSQDKIIPAPSSEFLRDVLNEAFSDNLPRSFNDIYISIRSLPGNVSQTSLESQIAIVLNVWEEQAQAQAVFLQASIPGEMAFYLKKPNDGPKAVAELMKVQRKDITIPREVVLKWISDYWVNLEKAVHQIRDKAPNIIMSGGTRYIIEVRTKMNIMTLSIHGSTLPEIDDSYDIRSMMEWISPIIKYVKDATSDKANP